MKMPSIIITFAWGAAATFCFYEVWMGAIGLVSCMIGLGRRRTECRAICAQAYDHGVKMLFYGLVFALFFVVCWFKLSLGRSEGQTLSFLVSATVVMAVVFPKMPGRIDRIWKNTNGE